MKAKLASLATLASMGLSAFAQESAGDTASGGVTIPESGVNIADYATAAITTLGGVVAVCVGGVICFMVVRWGIRWVRSIGRG